jgi:phosphate transport system protein
MREQFEQELHQLRLEVFQLGARVGQMTARAMQALLQHDASLAHGVIAEDGWADAQTVTIEDHAEQLIATQQPVASDMRQLASALIIAQELERMGDHAEGIARLSLAIGEAESLHGLMDDLTPIAERATEMLRLALEAYLGDDVDLAQRVIAMDEGVDALCRDYYAMLLTQITADSGLIARGVGLMHVAHNLERVADRSTNVCERVIFIATGELPRPRDGATEPMTSHG